MHPESVIHSAVQFADGSIKAQLGMPDMRIPIQYAFSYPGRLSLNCPRLDLFALKTMHFERPDSRTFRCLAAAYEAIRRGGNMPCICNAANEVANAAFRSGRIGFLQIADVIERMMQEVATRRLLRSTIICRPMPRRVGAARRSSRHYSI